MVSILQQVGMVLGPPTTRHGQTTRLVVRRRDHDGGRLLVLDEVEDAGEGAVVGQDFMHLGGGIVVVSCVVDA